MTLTNNILAENVLHALIQKGVREFCLCPSKRNAPLVYPLTKAPHLNIYYWPEERSAAFFALGRIKATGRPVAVLTTSGTAVGELLPAAMEAHYTGLPLVLVTADRPRRFRGSGAPQSAEQVGLFGCYAHHQLDLADGDCCQLEGWQGQGPLHLNVCFEEPQDKFCRDIALDASLPIGLFETTLPSYETIESYTTFLKEVHFPLVIVGTLAPSQREETIRFLLHLQAPVYAEALSNIREDPRLKPLLISQDRLIWKLSAQHGYAIDGVLRIGGVPTLRLWRDLEDKQQAIRLCSISEQPFSGLDWATVTHTNLCAFFAWAQTLPVSATYPYDKWRQADHVIQQALLELFQEEPQAEPSLIHQLSTKISNGAKVYLGNSMPIREWDLAATYEARHYQMAANRGLNGIDGQLATFLGYSSIEQDNWAILGDLTALYDLVAPWITPQLPSLSLHAVIVNNKGSDMFVRMFAHPAFQNKHQLSFEPLAHFWQWRYEKWTEIPHEITSGKGGHLIELIPDTQATHRFWQRLNGL